MAIFYRVLAAGAKYGTRFAKYCWANKGKILNWIERGFSVGWIVDQVRQALGL